VPWPALDPDLVDLDLKVRQDPQETFDAWNTSLAMCPTDPLHTESKDQNCIDFQSFCCMVVKMRSVIKGVGSAMATPCLNRRDRE